MSVDVVIDCSHWERVGLERLARIAVDAVLGAHDLAPDQWEVAVLGCDDARISELNASFRNKAAPTNILSWPSAERAARQDGERPDPPAGGGELGDLAIAWETCAREARSGGKSLNDHALHLIVHGTLHLLGYDHVREADGDLMESTETAILATLGVANPYSGTATAGLDDDGKD